MILIKADVPAVWTKIIEAPIRCEELSAFVSENSHGATASFLGIVRDHNNGRRVAAVSYDAFIPLADKILKEIAWKACECWGVKIAAAHRLGELKVGEISVAVAIGAPHRAEAFAACRYVIDRIKERLPVWKREQYVDGGSEWLSGHALHAELPVHAEEL